MKNEIEISHDILPNRSAVSHSESESQTVSQSVGRSVTQSVSWSDSQQHKSVRQPVNQPGKLYTAALVNNTLDRLL